jgi:hypothetical protein
MRKGGPRPLGWSVGRQREKSRSATFRQIQLFQARQTKERDQRERFRQREVRRLGERKEAFHQEEGHHREEAEKAPAPAHRPGPSRASSWPVLAAQTPSEGSTSID